MSIDTWTRSRPDRCPGCGFHVETQGCACVGKRLKFAAQSATSEAHPEAKRVVEAAVRELAKSGRVFSANDLRARGIDPGGGVVGAVFGELSRAKVIRHVSYEPSTKPNTKAHDIKTWQGWAA